VRRRPALLSALTAAALVAVALAGCAPSATRGPGNQPAGCTPELPSGDASSIVKATGAVGKQPKVTFPTPLHTKTGQATVLRAGHGAVASTGGQVDFDFVVANGKTGKSIGGSGYNGQYTRLAAGSKVPQQDASGNPTGTSLPSSLTDALVCAQAGARIALVSTAKQLGLGDLSQYGIANSAAVATVVDVHAVYPGKADGVNQLPQDGMPNVITAVDGQPGIVVQELDKPTTVRSETVKAGGGAVLKKGQKAVLMLTAWTWPTDGGKPTVVEALDTWTGHQAATIDLTAGNGMLPAKVISSLVGQKVGSQMLVVLPPKDGYSASGAPTGVSATDTLIYVIDILGIAK
jgi:peptidylprolyl isomerase